MSITLTKTELNQLQPKDRIIAIDGNPILRIVAEVFADGRIKLRTPKGSKVEHFLYPDTQIQNDVTIERPAKRGPLEFGERVTRRDHPEREGHVIQVHDSGVISVIWDVDFSDVGLPVMAQICERRELKRVQV